MIAVVARGPQRSGSVTVDDHPALRLVTAGNTGDGKSTLINRLRANGRALSSDGVGMSAYSAATDANGSQPPTGSTAATPRQAINGDVAWRQFATPRRRFVIADTPGHDQHTGTMVAAAAGSDVAIVLVDITKIDWRADPLALPPQTRRHAMLVHLLRVPNIVFAVNKIDALLQPRQAFDAVCTALLAFAHDAGITVAAVLPLSAQRGDNVTAPIDQDWYSGPSLLQLLETLPATPERVEGDLLLPVQQVSHAEGDDLGGNGQPPRILWGRIAHGQVQRGDAVQLYPSGDRAVVAEVRRGHEQVDKAAAGQSVGLVLDRALDVSRGDWVGTPNSLLGAQRFGATLAWLDTEPATLSRRYLVRHGNRWVQARIASIGHRLDVGKLNATVATELAANDIGHVVVELQQPLPIEPYAHNRVAGSMIVVDPTHNRTSGALLVNVVR